MMRSYSRLVLIGLTVTLSILAVVAFAAPPNGLVSGKADVKSAGPLAFRPGGVLFVGDSVQASIFAIDTEDAKSAAGAPVDIQGINDKIAALVGTTADQIMINDVKVNPASKNIYISASRGKGPDAMPLLLRVSTAGKIEVLSLDRVKYAMVTLPDPAESKAGPRNPRMDTITQIAYVKGNILVAGLSNEEFSSNMRSIPFPFHNAAKGASIEIFHGSHKRYETNSPIRTFVPYTIGKEQFILAAYTCAPLVKIPVSELTPGSKVKGATIAELGFRRSSARHADVSQGWSRFPADGQQRARRDEDCRPSIWILTRRSPLPCCPLTAGVPYETIKDLTGVQHLEKFDDSKALILAKADTSASVSLRSHSRSPLV